MKLYIQALKLLINKFILGKDNGTCIKEFAEKMGVVYIKLAQILATQNYGDLFTERDRIVLSSICDECNPVDFSKIKRILNERYERPLDEIFASIDEHPIGSASVSQVHRAVLKNGEVVAIKVKRKDITRTIEEDLKRIRSLIHAFGRFFDFKNFMGSDKVIDKYLEWIREETDFEQEMRNIEIYEEFTKSIDGKVEGAKAVRVPKLYREYCREDVIVMEFIETPTINKLALTEENKKLIKEAMNNYIKSTFWAMFNHKPVVFHGDPHGGNICVDESGNVCFLDMGLLFVMDEEEAFMCRRFFMSAYSGNYDKLYDLISENCSIEEKDKIAFKEDCRRYCEDLPGKELTFYFMDMVVICTKYEIVPPDFLYNMAKAFVCLNGISGFTGNEMTAIELFKDQMIEFLTKRSVQDAKKVLSDGIRVVPCAIDRTLKYGLVRAAVEVLNVEPLHGDLLQAIRNLEEARDILKIYFKVNEGEDEDYGTKKL